nr:DUF6192 family protein [Streptomyces pseudovenezuelae]
MNERKGRSEWNGRAAKRVARWATATPVTVADKVEAIHDLTVDETGAAQAACELLYRPEMAFRAMRGPQARELVNQSQFDQADIEGGDGEEDWWDGPGEEDGSDDLGDPVTIAQGSWSAASPGRREPRRTLSSRSRRPTSPSPYASECAHTAPSASPRPPRPGRRALISPEQA